MTTLTLHSEPVLPEWLDAYGHLNEAYYLVPFSNASWSMQAHFAIGIDYFAKTGCAIYTVETHLRYLAEVRAPAHLQIETTILDADPKRIWFTHAMKADGTLRATGEFMALHYNTRKNQTTAMPKQTQTALQKAKAATPLEWASARIGFAGK